MGKRGVDVGLEAGAFIREFLGGQGVTLAGPDARLELPSLVLVALVEELEVAFHFRARPSEINPANFSSLARIESYVNGKRT